MRYHYVRFARDEQGDVLIVGGEDHKTGQAKDCAQRFVNLERWARARFPFVAEVTDRWSGQVMEPLDGVAYIGCNPGDKNVYVVTGDSGNGITHGILAGLLIVDLIAGKSVGETIRSFTQDIEAAHSRGLRRRERERCGAISRLHYAGLG